MYVEILVSKKQRACLQGWALASTFHFPFCHSWFLHCIISCITSAQSGLISWKCKIKIKPRVSRWHSLCVCSPNPRALLGKWELVFPAVKWPPVLEGSVYSRGRDETETWAKQQNTLQKASGISLKEIELLPTYQTLSTLPNPCTFYYVFCLLMDVLESANSFQILMLFYLSSLTAVVFFCNFWINTQTCMQPIKK